MKTNKPNHAANEACAEPFTGTELALAIHGPERSAGTAALTRNAPPMLPMKCTDAPYPEMGETAPMRAPARRKKELILFH